MARVTGILGKKVGMTQLFDSKGDVRPATVLQAGPCVITQHKTQTKDGYESAQIGLVEFVKEKKLTKAMRGHFAKHNLPPVKFVREVDVEVDAPGETTEGVIKAGDRVLVDIFEGERFVDVVGVSKGHGFQGVVKRHHFARRSEVARFDVSDYGFDWLVGISVARVQGHADVGPHGRCPDHDAQPADSGRG